MIPGPGAVAEVAAQEFDNDLTIIRAAAEMAMQSTEPGDPCRKWLLEIRLAATRASVKTASLREFAVKRGARPSCTPLKKWLEACS